MEKQEKKECEKTKKEKWKEMGAKDRLVYFLDYYALKAACILFLVICAVYFTVNYLTKEEPVFYILTMNADGEKIAADGDGYFDPFLEEQGVDTRKNTVSLELGAYDANQTGDSLGAYSLEKVRVLFMAQCVDLLWTDESFLEVMASTGYIADLTGFVPGELLESYGDSLIYGKDAETGKKIVIGIRIDGKENEWLKDTGWYSQEGIVAAANGAPHPELLKEMLLDILE